MSIGAISGVASGVLGTAGATGTSAASGLVGPGVLGGTPGDATPVDGGGFGGALTRAIGSVEGAQAKADGLAQLAATGQLSDVHDYTIAATQAQLMTSLAVSVSTKAVEAFNEIMRMQV